MRAGNVDSYFGKASAAAGGGPAAGGGSGGDAATLPPAVMAELERAKSRIAELAARVEALESS